MAKNIVTSIPSFQNKIWNFYTEQKRDFPWRDTKDPYKILVSEFMLQQTQANRVIPKYISFVKRFPSISHLSKASLEEVLHAWQGLGYNRRALYLKNAVERIESGFDSLIPNDVKTLSSLKGIGINTAGAVIAFAYNLPVVFIETNIRRVFIHEFFNDKDSITDKQILDLIQKSLPKKDTKYWYYALMDYGAYLSRSTVNPNRKSKHYSVQSKFEGSSRQLRGKVLKELLKGSTTIIKLEKVLNDNRTNTIVTQLVNEGFVVLKNNELFLKK